MAYFSYKNICIRGVAAAIPKHTIYNLTSDSDESIGVGSEIKEKYVKITGVKERHISYSLTTSDLCFHSADKLLLELGWSRESIDILVFVSQSGDYSVPPTSCLLLKRLNLGSQTYCIDLSLGCSGWVYGLNHICSLISSGCGKRALLLTGDSKDMKYSRSMPLFGHAGSATAIEYGDNAQDICFSFSTDGSKYDSIIIPHAGCRNLMSLESYHYHINEDGQKSNKLELSMKGINVFSYSVKIVPESIIKLAETFRFDYKDCDFVVLHQANKMINKAIANYLKMDERQCPSSLELYGNTSSATIPLTMVTELRKGLNLKEKLKFICCGFGVGLSCGTASFSTSNLLIVDLLQIEE